MKDTVDAFVEIFELEGASDGPLAGLDFAAKDIFDVAGHVTGCGNPTMAAAATPASAHADPVAALLAAGARLRGKTHTDEIAYSLMGANAHHGTPVNPADPRRVPGGSSSGSVSATAAGLVDIGLGSDTGGSVRMPASFCGIYGMRSSHGAIPMRGTMPLAPSFDTVGWFARDPETLDRVADALGLHPAGQSVTRLLLPVDAWARAAPETVEAVSPALARLEARLGPATPVILAPEGLDTWRETFRVCQAAEVWQAHGAWVERANPAFGPGVADRFRMAAAIEPEEWRRAREARETVRERMQTLLTGGCALVLPTSPGPAPLREAAEADLDRFRMRALEMLCPAGLAGMPQISLPAGTVDGGPVGLGLVAARGMDRGLIALARDAANRRD